MQLIEEAKLKTNQKSRIILWGIFYWIVITICFMRSLQIRWSGTFFADYNLLKYSVATLITLLLLFALPRDDSITSLFILVILFLVVFPMGIIYSCQNERTVYYLSVTTVTLFVELLSAKINMRPVRIQIGTKNPSVIVIWLMIGLLMLSVAVMYRERGAPNFRALDLSLTYEIRSSYLLSSFASDLYNSATKAVIPFLIAVTIYKKRYKLVILLLTIQFVFFLWLANKTTIFSLAVFAFGYFVTKRKNGRLIFTRVMTIGVAILAFLEEILSSVATGFSSIVDLAYSLIIRRTLFEPALLKFNYFDYFIIQNKPKTGLFGTIIAPLLTRIGFIPPYNTVSYPKMIGIQYLDGSSANTGLFGEEMAHFGFFGVFIAGLFLLVFLLCVKRSEIRNGKIFTCCMALYLVFGFADSGVVQLINFSPMLLITIILAFFSLNAIEEIEEPRRKRWIRFAIKS